MLIQQHKAHSRFLPFFLCNSCLISLYQAISLLPPPQSSQVQHLVLAAPLCLTKNVMPKLPFPGGCSSSHSTSDSQLLAIVSTAHLAGPS